MNVDPTRTSLTGTGGKINIGKQGGGNWRYNGGLVWRSPELELNDVGFLRKTDEIIQFAEINYLWQIPTKIYRDIKVSLEQLSNFDFQGNQNEMEYKLEGRINWINNWSTNLGLGHNPLLYENAYLRGGPRWRFANKDFVYFFLNSDSTKKLSFTVGYIKRKTERNINNLSKYVVRTNYQPFDAFSMSLNTELQQTVDKTQYITTTNFGAEKRYVLGQINNQNWSTTLRLNYSLNPNFSVQFYGQPFISRGRYSDFNFVNNPTASSFSERITLYDENQISYTNDPIAIDLNNDGKLEYDFPNGGYLVDDNMNGNLDYAFKKPDFSFVQLQTNLVVRWEYIPGSELFFVWSRGSAGSQDFNDSLTDSVRNQVFDIPASDTFLIKATYRFVR